MKNISPLQLVIFDWAGTTVDHGCCAPTIAFIKGFKQYGVDITMAQAREPMGMEKRDHIAAVGKIEEVKKKWQKIHNRAMSEEDIDEMYQNFRVLLLEALRENNGVISGVVDTIAWLRTQGLKIGGSTGYFKEAADIVEQVAAAEGYTPDYSISATEVPAGRPAPWMIYRVMEKLSVFPPHSVVNVGDTVVDMESARNAGVWAVGVARTGNLCGLSFSEFNTLPSGEKKTTVARAKQRLTKAGAHYVIDNVGEMPSVIEQINKNLVHGNTP